MTKTKQLVAIILISLAASSLVSAQTAVDLVELIGKKRSEVPRVFPGATSDIKGWQGWDNI